MSMEPSLDPTEPISPEAVLVSPELREPALARARQFPTAVPQAATRQPAVARVKAVAPATRPRRARALLLSATAGAAVTLAAIALLPAARDAPSLVPLPRDGGRVETSAQATTSTGTTAHSTRERLRRARAATSTATSVGDLSPPATAQPKRKPTSTAPRLALRAERNVLNSPRFFIRLGARGTRFVDPTMRLFRSRVSVRCTPHPDATRLSCVVRRGNASLTVLYLRTNAHSFRLVQP
jgi:hypothetical protein